MTLNDYKPNLLRVNGLAAGSMGASASVAEESSGDSDSEETMGCDGCDQRM